MIASDEKRVLFVHVQKTGGSTLDNILLERLAGAHKVSGLRGDRHATWRIAIKRYPEFADYYTFGFVRNPWARLESWWRMIDRINRNSQLKNHPSWMRVKFWRDIANNYEDFEQFILDGTQNYGRLRRPQLHYLQSNGARGREADFIGRTESYDQDLAQVFEQIGLEPLAKVPRDNANPPSDYRSAYTPEMRDLVGQHFAADIERFGYDF